jgi:hypothetical protein
MDRTECNRDHILTVLAWVALISILIVSLLAEASAKEVESTADLSVQESPVQNPPKQKTHVDPFTIAIIGLSMGCMLVASSVHWNMTQRKELGAQIQGLDSFLTSSCAVECLINGCNDNDPMVSNIKDIKNGRDAKLKDYEEHKNVMVRSISEIEAEIMRIWG